MVRRVATISIQVCPIEQGGKRVGHALAAVNDETGRFCAIMEGTAKECNAAASTLKRRINDPRWHMAGRAPVTTFLQETATRAQRLLDMSDTMCPVHRTRSCGCRESSNARS